MTFIFVLSIALALAMDAFAVSVSLSASLQKMSGPQTFRLATGFGLFQFFMPLLGWLAGQTIVDSIKSFDHWVAFGLLAIIGTKMILESFKSEESVADRAKDPTKGLVLLLLSVATSIDALAVGLSFAALDVPVLVPSFIIGIVASSMTILGTKLGPVFGRLLGKKAELVGGSVLIFIGIKILIEHLS